MKPASMIRGLWRNARGNALVTCAATMPLVIGAAAIGVDTIQVSVAKRQLQRSADSAALAGAHALYRQDPVMLAVRHDLTLNEDVRLSGAPIIENAPGVGSYAGNQNAVRVSLAAERSVPFIAFFTGSRMRITAEATALVQPDYYCLVALERTPEIAISFTGNSTINVGCGAASNSPAAVSVQAPGSSTINADPIRAVGGIPESSNYAAGTRLLPSSPAIDDPFAHLPNPSVPVDCQPQYVVNDNTPPLPFIPSVTGVYCYRGMEIKGTVRLPDNAVIVIDGGQLSFSSQANVTGNNVTIILTSREAASRPQNIAGLNINGDATVNLTAPTSGRYAGVLFYQDRRARFDGIDGSGKTTTNINGGSTARYTGGFYFPSRRLVFNGNASVESQCIRMVARRLNFSGNFRIDNSCTDEGRAGAGDQNNAVRLVA